MTEKKTKPAKTKKTKALSEKKEATYIKDMIRFEKAIAESGLKDFVRYLKSPWRIVWSNFLGGIFRGLGILIGMTMIVGIVIWILTQLVNFPLIGEYIGIVLGWVEQLVPVDLMKQLDNVKEAQPKIY